MPRADPHGDRQDAPLDVTPSSTRNDAPAFTRPAHGLPRGAAAWVLAAACGLLLAKLGGNDLWAPDEPRYAQIAEEVRARPRGAADWVLLRLGGEPYTQKPPLYFWIAAALGETNDRVSEWAARLPSALAGIATVALTLAWGTRVRGRTVGIAGAAILLTSWEFAHLARRAQLDVLLTFWIALALVAFWHWDRGDRRSRGWIAVVHAAMGLAVLTKGPVGVLLPLLIVVAYHGWERRLRDARPLFAPWAFALSLGPGLVWLAGAAALAPDGYLAEAVGENVIGRFFAGTSHARPFYYYLYQFPILFLPWTPLWIFAWRALPGAPHAREPGGDRARRFLLSWVGVTLVFFTLSAGKRGLYLLPAFPATALLCADGLARAWTRRAIPGSAVRALAATAAAIGATGVGAYALAGARGLSPSPWLVAGSIAAPLCAFAVWRVTERCAHPALALATALFAFVVAVEALVFAGYFPVLDPEKSPRPLARAAAALTRGGEPVGLYAKRALAGGLQYYADRPVATLANADALRTFVREGGRVLVVKERDLERVRGVAPVEIVARARSGRRTLLVVRVVPGADTSAQ